MTTEVVPRATVRDMVRRRDATIELYAKAFVALNEAQQALKEAGASLSAIDTKDGANRYAYSTREEEKSFVASLTLPSRDVYAGLARKIVDRRAWASLVRMTDLESLMDTQAKDELRRQLQEEVPEVTEENAWATLQQFLTDADTIFKRGIANCFSELDRRFRSHDGWKIGSRVILTNMFDSSGFWSYSHNRRDVMHDIDRTFCVLDGNRPPDMLAGIVAAVEQARGNGWGARQTEIDSDYFKVRAFKNGNAHIWFKRPDLLERVNKMLGEYYNAGIPEEREAKADPLSTPKTSLAKNYGFFPTPDRVAALLLESVPLYRREDELPKTVLEPSAGTGSLARLAAAKGAQVDCVEVHPERAVALRSERRYRNVVQADFLTLRPDRFYDVVVMNPPFDRERDIDHVLHAMKFLKPDGSLHAIMSAGTEFRETRKSSAFRELMEAKGAQWRDLPAGSFSSAGTNVNTVILRFQNDGKKRWW